MSVGLFLFAVFSSAAAQGILYLNKGEACDPIGHVTRRCKRLDDCPQAVSDIRVRHYPEICSFEDRHPIICCPELIATTTEPTTTRHPDEGSICNNTSPPYYCRRQEDCPGIREAIRQRRYPKICSFINSRTPIICCPPDLEASPPPETTTSRWSSSWSRPDQTDTPWTRPTSPPHQETSENSLVDNFGTSSTSESTSALRGLKSEQKCKEYAKYVYKKQETFVDIPGNEEEEQLVPYCGRIAEPLIVEGEDAGVREFPHMALIGYGQKNKIDWLCGGSLISERFILSAAHCTRPVGRYARWAKLGDLDISKTTDDASPVIIQIIEWHNHRNYEGKVLYNDIALYKLETDAPLGIYIRPICLNTKPITSPKALASGWGHTSWHGNSSNMLQKVELDIIPNDRCNKSYLPHIGEDRELPSGINPKYMICAGGIGGKDTCQGDSGGPLQIPLETPYCTYAIIGITSFGKGCGANAPGVYTNVANYIPWIESIVWPS